MEKITFDSRLEQIKIVVVEKVSSWDSVPQSIGSREEASRVGLKSRQWNTKGMTVVCYNVRGISGFSHEF